jgi:DNA anti-recombination protein RmuC
VNGNNFDERINRLTERHEALAHSLELMEGRLNDTITAMNQDGENIRSLVRLAELHQQEHEQFRADLRAVGERDAQRGKELDDRINKLVGAIGELIGRMPRQEQGQ